MDEPEPPTNVWIEHADGSTTPLELTFEGMDENDFFVWKAVGVSRAFSGDSILRADVLPARTVIAVPVYWSDEPE